MENENVKMAGVYLNTDDIKRIIESTMDWVEIVEGQTFCAKNVLKETTPIGTSIIIGIDGIKCEEGSDEIKLVISSGVYELPVKTAHPNDEMSIRFDYTIPIPGTFGVIGVDGLDILTNEEKEFKAAINEMLGDRTDEYAEMFRKDNERAIGGRGLVLLEKAKAEIKNEDILADNDVTPIQLMSTFIELTERYVETCGKLAQLDQRHADLLKMYEDTYEEGSKKTKKLAKDVEVIDKKIGMSKQLIDYCLATINAAVMPVLNIDLHK